MNVALLEQIASILLQAIEAGIQYGPQIVADIRQLYSLAVSGTALTPAQQTQADQTFAAAHQALQASVAADAQTDGQTPAA